MKNRLLQRMLSLLLTFALVLSLVCTAGAADLATDLANAGEELTLAEDAETDELTVAEEVPQEEAEADVEEPVESAQAEEEESTVEREETEPAEEPAQEEVAQPEEPSNDEITSQDEASEEAPVEEQEVETEEDTVLNANTTDNGWSVKVNRVTGECEFSFSYKEQGTSVEAAEGYYEIPQGTAQANGERYTFQAGIYYFDESGNCEQSLQEENVQAEVNELDTANNTYTVVDTNTYEVSLGSVNCEDNVVSSEVTLFTGVEEVDDLYHEFDEGQDLGLYSGSFVHEDLGEICFATNGQILNETGSYHWYDSALYSFKELQNGIAVGSIYTGTYKFGAIPASLQDEYKTGVVYYLVNGKGIEADSSYHWYKSKLYRFDNSEKYNGRSVGALYTGTHQFGSLPASLQDEYKTGVVYYLNKGEGMEDDGSCHWYKSKLYRFNNSDENHGMSVGSIYNGTYKFGAIPASLQDEYKTGVVYYLKQGQGVEDDNSYHWYNSKLYRFDNSEDYEGRSVGTAYSGYHYCATVPASVKNYTAQRWYLFKNGSGTLLTGYVSGTRTYYNKGVVDTSLSGWKTISGKTYYFKKGVACSGWNYLTRNGGKYKYYFRSDGSLVTDLYAYFGNSYYKKKQMVYVNRYSNNITTYLYNSDTKSYDIPLKSMVCSTSKTMNLKYGTYTVSKFARWYHKGKWYWQYLTRIGSTGALFHSCRYYSKSYNSMQSSNYNSMGQCNSDLCVRAAVGSCRLIYNVVDSQSSGAVKCKYYYAKNNGPFGRMTVANTTGKVSGTKATDPTQ